MDIVSKTITSFGEYISLIVQVIGVSIRHPPQWKLIRDQLYAIGVQSFTVVAITGLSTGMVFAAQSYFQLADKGLASATGIMVAKAMLVELGPVLTAFMVTGRVGASMCAELGTMRVTEQVDAMRSMSVEPYRYLVAPRFIGGTLMMPLLTIFSSITGILGGYLVAVKYYHMPSVSYIDPLRTNITAFDIFAGLTKAFVFGIIVVTISCFKGLKTTGGAAGVGKSTTNCVVICYSVILVINFFLTLWLNSAHDYIEPALRRLFS